MKSKTFLVIIGAVLVPLLVAFIFQTASRSVPTQTTRYEVRTDSPTAHYPIVPDSPVRNVILFVGDGMGINQITASRIKLLGPDARLHMERMPVTGFITTHCEDSLITDSGASGSALATGYKVPYRHISVNRKGEHLLTILEAARAKGMATGLVTTTEIVDATPAAFGAHVAHRDSHNTIAKQLVESGIDVLMGGGKKHFIPQSQSGSERSDETDLIARIKSLGYTYVETVDEMKKARSPKLFGLFSTEELKDESPKPSVGEMTAKAIQILSKHKSGFFLMVETERTDEDSHANQFDLLAKGVMDFDEAVRMGIEFAQKDRRTLVLVTADHETGGLQFDKGGPVERQLQVVWTTTRHTGQPVPVFAFGPHAMKFTGLRDNTDIPRTIATLLRIKNFPRVVGE